MDPLNVFMNKGLFGLVSSPGFQKFTESVSSNETYDIYGGVAAVIGLFIFIIIIAIIYLVLCYIAIGKVITGSSRKCMYWRLFFYVLLTLNISFFPMIPVGFIFIIMWLARVKICN